MRIRIKEARQKYKENTGKKMTMDSLAEAVMSDRNCSLKTKRDILQRMQRGAIAHPSLEIIKRISLTCGVDYNFLISN